MPTDFSSISPNSTAFEANSRIPGLGGVLAPPVPSLSSDALNQFTNSPVPPPTEPPVPNLQASFSTIPGLGTDPSLAARRSSVEATYQSPDTARTLPNIAVEKAPESISYREEGELSDGELGEDTDEVEVSNQSDQEMGNALPRPTEEPSLSEDDGSVSSYNPPSVSSLKPLDPPEPPAIAVQEPVIDSINTVADLKTKAKGAILSLLPHNITFQNLVDEGINESILRQLYNEVGIKDTTLEAKGSQTQRQAILQVEKQDAQPNAQQKSVPPLSSPLDPSSTRVAIDGNPQLPGDEIASDISVNPQTQPTSTDATPGAASAAVERKDRIAQLLALKAAKTTKSQSPSNSVTNIDQHVVQAITPPSNTQAKAIQPSAESIIKPASVADDQVGNKKKAQTDLVRAKMEALKQQALAKAQAQRAAQLAGANLTGNTLQSSPAPVPPPRASETPTRQIGSSVVPQSLRGTIVGNGEGPAGRSSQKRPLAADLFDEATPTAKRHVPNKQSHDNVDLVSDDEGEVSDVGMDLDGDSDLSEGEVEDVSKPMVLNQPQSADLSGSKATPKRHDGIPSDVSNTSAPPSASVTPTREKAQEELSRSKDDQIAMMKKRIAEMELRRKAKQIAIDKGLSPGPGTPAPADLRSAAVSSLPASAKQQFAGDASARAEALKRRLIRRREIQAGIPAIDAEVERTRSRLAEIQKEAERLEAELRKGLEGRQQLLRELELLGVDAETVPLERMRLPELKAVRDELVEAQKQEQAPEASEKKVADSTLSKHSEAPPGRTDSISGASGIVPEPGQENKATPEVGLEEAGSEDSAMDESSASLNEPTDDRSERRPFEDSLTPAARTNTLEISPQGGASLSLTTDEKMSSQPPAQIDLSANATHEGSEDDSGSVSMSDSGSESSEEYEPAESHASDLNAPDDASPSGNVHSDNEYESTDTAFPGQQRGEAISQETPEKIVPDLENSQEITESNIMVKPHDTNDPKQEAAHTEPQKPNFVPYDSILKSFRNYRFNPQFINEVAGGYRSLTYSCKIDARKVLCRTETNGEICNDPTCEDQHFAQMGLPDDKILVEMSSASGMDKDTRNRYLNGLKSVIGDLRSRGVKDFEQVAKELAAFRRRFEAEQDPLLAPASDASQTDP